MSKLPVLSPHKLIKLLEAIGFQRTRQKGSHIRFTHPDGRKTIVPMHSSGVIGRGLLNKIIKDDLRMSREEFLKLLE